MYLYVSFIEFIYIYMARWLYCCVYYMNIEHVSIFCRFISLYVTYMYLYIYTTIKHLKVILANTCTTIYV